MLLPVSTLFSRIAQTVRGNSERGLSAEDQRDFRAQLAAWKPRHGRSAVMIRWRITEWCNYACHYCSQEHGRFTDRGQGFTSHAFDNFPLEQWQSAFRRHFGDSRLSITISGGEPLLDRQSMIPMLNFLSSLPGTECIRIDTNVAWRPVVYQALDKSKLLLNASYHPTQVSKDAFVAKIKDILQHGFRIGKINYVMTQEQFDDFASLREELAQLGLVVNPNPDHERTVDYSEEQKELLRAYLPEIDYRFKVLLESPQGQKCLFPAIAYTLDFRGLMQVSCVPGPVFSIFGEQLEPLPAGPVACPHGGCGCLDMYSFVKGSQRNVTINPFQEYCEQLAARAREVERGIPSRPAGA